MDRKAIVARLAPCGLDCGRCMSHPESPIRRLAGELAAELGNLGARAAFFAKLDPVFENYPAFEAMLGFLQAGTCEGCRTGKCLLENCVPQRCVTERGVDFCFECREFPCDRVAFQGPLRERWRKNNELMRDMGLAAYLAMTLAKPRY